MSTYLARKQAGLRHSFARLAANGLLIAATLRMGATAAGTYDAVADSAPTAYAHTVNLAGFRYQVIDDATSMGGTLSGELLLIQGSDLPAGAKPAEKDSVEIAGEAWDITRVTPDPVELTFILSIRRA